MTSEITDLEMVEIGLIKLKNNTFRAFLPSETETVMIIDIISDSGSRCDFEMFFKKKKQIAFSHILKVDKNMITLNKLFDLACAIRKKITETFFDSASSGVKVKRELVEWDPDESDSEWVSLDSNESDSE